jgi:perosamine synthetase
VAGIEPEDEVLVPALTFIAPVNAVRYAGGWPVFMDVEPQYWQMDVTKVREFLRQECQWKAGQWWNKTTNRRVKAILPVHLLGHPVDFDPLLEEARERGLVVIEDAAESLGARYKGRKVGSLGDLACLSFNGNKIITTGGGGMLLTDNAAWAERARYLTTQAKDDVIEYVHNTIGFNYRLTNLQAALGCAQLESLDDYIAAKRQLAARYREAFADVEGLTCMRDAPWAFAINWLFTILVHPESRTTSRRLLQAMQDRGIQARPLWQPLHRSPAHQGSQAYRVEVADNLHHLALSLPSSVGLTVENLDRVIQAVKSLLGRTDRSEKQAG